MPLNWFKKYLFFAVQTLTFNPWFEQNLPIFDTIETELHWGYVSDSEVGRFDYMNTTDGRVLLLAKPDHLSLTEAYEYIIAHLNR